MKIAFIINSLAGGGAERVVSTLSNYLVEHGHEIYIILLEKEKQQYTLNKKINLIVLKTAFLNKGIGKIISIPLQSLALSRLLTKLELNNAISFLVRANLVFTFTKFLSNSHVIISERNYSKKQYEKKNTKNFLMNFMIKALYPKADKIISVSEIIKNDLVSHYALTSEKIQTIYNPQDIKYIQNLTTKKLLDDFQEDYIYFITVGRLIAQKDHATMIKAFNIVNKKFPKTKLLILGKGSQKEYLQDMIKQLNLKNKVVLQGFVNNTYDYLKQANIFLLSSKFEGFPNVIIEAMTCGLPIISTNCPSGPFEILANGKHGILTEVQDSEALASAMVSMLDKDTSAYYSQESLKRVKDFDVSLIANQYLNILNTNR